MFDQAWCQMFHLILFVGFSAGRLLAVLHGCPIAPIMFSPDCSETRRVHFYGFLQGSPRPAAARQLRVFPADGLPAAILSVGLPSRGVE